MEIVVDKSKIISVNQVEIIIKDEVAKFYNECHGNKITTYSLEGFVNRIMARMVPSKEENSNVDKEG